MWHAIGWGFLFVATVIGSIVLFVAGRRVRRSKEYLFIVCSFVLCGLLNVGAVVGAVQGYLVTDGVKLAGIVTLGQGLFLFVCAVVMLLVLINARPPVDNASVAIDSPEVVTASA